MLKQYYQKKLAEKITRGIVVLDKGAGVTSHDEVAALRKIFRTQKVGHSGTLDPKVTGVLVCGLGKGTKVLEYVLLSEKIYIGELVLHGKVSQKKLSQVVGQFQGKIEQLPPTRSSVIRQVREREVYGLKLIVFNVQTRIATIRCAVERGTYIRKLFHDMGGSLGVGAHMGDLHRIQAGPFNEKNSRVTTTEELQILKGKAFGADGSKWGMFDWWYVRKMGQRIMPIETALVDLPIVTVNPQTVKYITRGTPLYRPGVVALIEAGPRLTKQGDTVQIQTTAGKVVAIGKVMVDGPDLQTGEKGEAVRISKVLI